MADTRVQIAVHFTWDPAKDEVAIPKEVTTTTVVGDDYLDTKKISSAFMSEDKKNELLLEMSKLKKKAGRKAQPKKEVVESKPAEKEGEQGSLL
jgi:hypothetical protein